MLPICTRAASRLFDYPEADYSLRLTEFERACKAVSPLAADAANQLSQQLASLDLGQLRELYTRTFDLTPVCPPYLSVHLFGEGNFKRAHLMTGLAELYASRGIAPRGELPDHLAVVLAAMERLEPEERDELIQFCLVTALEKMRVELARQANPYALAMTALEQLIPTWKTQTDCKTRTDCGTQTDCQTQTEVSRD